jgi:hypothetical protein
MEEQSFLELLELTPDLTDLSITGCRDLVKAVSMLVSIPNRLRSLNASKIHMDDASLCDFIKKSPFLEYLNLADTGLYLNDNDLISAFSDNQCKLLQVLHVSNCAFVSDKFVEFLLEHKPPLLQLLSLTATAATRGAVNALQMKYPLLQIHFIQKASTGKPFSLEAIQ